LGIDNSLIGEVALTVYALVATAAAYTAGRYAMIPFLLLYAAAFGTTAGIELAQALSSGSDPSTAAG
jgi:hypothetical protein